MKTTLKYFFLPLSLFFTVTISASFISDSPSGKPFPYKSAGLSDRQAAAHLLSRFTYGARPGDIDAALKIGLEKWFSQQLMGDLADDSLNLMLKGYNAINLTNNEVSKLYPNPGQILRLAIKDGIISQDSIVQTGKKDYREQLKGYMLQKGFRPQAELQRQLINQKILRAAYSNNQTRELLTDFWFNHFNVSLTKGQSAEFIPAYERDVIRPNVFGSFENLVLATAKSPAMLTYLDNVTSSGTPESLSQQVNPQVQKRMAARASMNIADTAMRAKAVAKLQQNKKTQGLNENYAREVMELHTLGVDGGYSQSDVTQAARILTGWTVYPMENGYASAAKNLIERIGEQNLEKRGFVHEGDFLFAANRHDTGEKTVLGRKFPANGGYEEGVELLKMLANHTSSAKFISRKIAIRFVNDNPSQKLVDNMSAVFIKSKGNIAEVLLTMVSSPEFWNKEALREKTKSPFELAISAVRSLDADIYQPYQLFTWINKMGQKIYSYQAPTGFPDKGQYWINTGSLLNRMNFGLALASQRIPGIRVNLAAMNKNREPESSEAALVTYGRLIMPERDLSQTVDRLRPMLNDPELQKKIEVAASKNAVPETSATMVDPGVVMMDGTKEKQSAQGSVKRNDGKVLAMSGSNTMLAQVVGIILGSPEFQRK
ncbi:DUF1800 domain-containing protein [Daejeonella lutea]|uniref:Uncharacterized conserved protein, DUF1800 family n=1 Tax=Daejeonella lutea TaxID=572036 RepID=A0A1T5ASR9_9SPHI|nr:DUF1800 domain-containing protein [Daejeonella lutea]SKB37909.1 Uncharacterized conserved protein, DUF1800 family [Daejeonella lutea]